MDSNRKKELWNLIKAGEKSLRAKRIKVFIGAWLTYSIVAFFLIHPDDGFLADAVASIFIGIFILFVTLLWCNGFLHLYESDKRLKEMEKEFNNLND